MLFLFLPLPLPFYMTFLYSSLTSFIVKTHCIVNYEKTYISNSFIVKTHCIVNNVSFSILEIVLRWYNKENRFVASLQLRY